MIYNWIFLIKFCVLLESHLSLIETSDITCETRGHWSLLYAAFADRSAPQMLIKLTFEELNKILFGALIYFGISFAQGAHTRVQIISAYYCTQHIFTYAAKVRVNRNKTKGSLKQKRKNNLLRFAIGPLEVRRRMSTVRGCVLKHARKHTVDTSSQHTAQWPFKN